MRATLIARHGIFDQESEEYQVLDEHGAEEFDEWVGAFSVAADRYEELTGEPIDSAEYQLVETTDGPLAVHEFEPIVGTEGEGIAVLDGVCYEFHGGTAGAHRVEGSTWDSPFINDDFCQYVVVRNGDEMTWRGVEADVEAEGGHEVGFAD